MDDVTGEVDRPDLPRRRPKRSLRPVHPGREARLALDSALQAATHLGDVRRRSAEHQQHRDVPRVGPDVRRELRPVEDRQPIDHNGSLDGPARPGQSRRSRRPPLHSAGVLGRYVLGGCGRPTVRW